jgi:hypothetical protein
MSFAKKLYIAIDFYLREYKAAEGRGLDAYSDEYLCHPMADGKYLSTLAELYQSNIISLVQFSHSAASACKRLEGVERFPFKQGACWGLDFSWRNLAVTEPFLITSAIITRGLLDCSSEVLLASQAANLLRLGRDGLKGWIRELSIAVDDRGLTLPAYSPNIREPIYNAAAYALATLRLIDESEGRVPSNRDTLHAIEWIRLRRVPGLGWPYSPTSPVIDLLHQCYLLNALADVFGVRSIEHECAEMLGQFAGPCCFADTMRLVRGSEEFADARDIPWLRPLGDCFVEVLPKPARLWSLGELLVLLSRLGLEGKHSEAWVRQGRRVATLIMSRLSAEEDTEARYPRHVMHAVHGLACYLALLRKRARGNKHVDTTLFI